MHVNAINHDNCTLRVPCDLQLFSINAQTWSGKLSKKAQFGNAISITVDAGRTVPLRPLQGGGGAVRKKKPRDGQYLGEAVSASNHRKLRLFVTSPPTTPSDQKTLNTVEAGERYPNRRSANV